MAATAASAAIVEGNNGQPMRILTERDMLGRVTFKTETSPPVTAVMTQACAASPTGTASTAPPPLCDGTN